MLEGDPILSIESLTIRFGGVTACEDIDLQLERGSIHALIGPNGAGKTSIVNAITGVYVPERQARVLLHVDGHATSLLGLKPHRIVRSGVGRTFQHLGTIPFLTVTENLLLGRTIYERSGVFANGFRLPRARDEERRQREHTGRVIQLLGLEASADIPVRELPYGTQKLVDLGRALVGEPRLLVLDEPVAGMVRSEKSEVVESIGRIRREMEITILVIEHDMPVVQRLADRVTVLNFGRKIAEGAPSEVLESEAVIAAYIGRPVTT